MVEEGCLFHLSKGSIYTEGVKNKNARPGGLWSAYRDLRLKLVLLGGELNPFPKIDRESDSRASALPSLLLFNLTWCCFQWLSGTALGEILRTKWVIVPSSWIRCTIYGLSDIPPPNVSMLALRVSCLEGILQLLRDAVDAILLWDETVKPVS